MTHTDKVLKEFNENIKSFLRQSNLVCYKQGLRDAEGTKNGAQRYQLGYDDAKQDVIAEVVRRIDEMIKEGQGSNPLPTRESTVLSDLRATLLEMK